MLSYEDQQVAQSRKNMSETVEQPVLQRAGTTRYRVADTRRDGAAGKYNFTGTGLSKVGGTRLY